MTADDMLCALRDGKAPGAHAAVLGGGLVGLETADALCARGVRVEIFEQAGEIGAGLNGNRMAFIRERLVQGGCTAHCRARVEAVEGAFVRYEQDGERRASGPFDAFVTAMGRRSRRTLAQALREACPDISVVCIGDAQHPATAMEAVAQAAQMAAAHVPQGAKVQPENA